MFLVLYSIYRSLINLASLRVDFQGNCYMNLLFNYFTESKRHIYGIFLPDNTYTGEITFNN